MESADTSQSEERGLAGEEAARANLYALIGRLFYDAPDELLLATISRSDLEGDDGPLGAAWRELTPYTSHYVKTASPDHHLVRLRELLGNLELARRDAASEPEDHISGVCDVMRYLVSSGASFDQQDMFFNEFVCPAVESICDAIQHSPNAAFYRCVAQLSLQFMALEKAAFELKDG
jgi:TorA maturation chaperone TorD